MSLGADGKDLLRSIAASIRIHAPTEGETATPMPGLKLYRLASTALVQRGVFRPAICIVAQGDKLAHAGEDTPLRYGAGDFIVSSVDMPMVGQVLGATSARPYLAAAFDLGPQEVLSVVRDAKIRVDESAATAPATFVGRADLRLLQVVQRALSSLDDEREARFLAPLLRKELIYRLVTGPNAHAVCQAALLARPDEGVGRAVDWLRAHFKEPLRIQALARVAKMSSSSLHHKFKATVLMGPLQYQKRLRLEEARRLLLGGLADAAGAAFDVGYESPSQFTREYRRLFGLPPLRDVKHMRTTAGEARTERRPSPRRMM